jgi:hypothetical protein
MRPNVGNTDSTSPTDVDSWIGSWHPRQSLVNGGVGFCAVSQRNPGHANNVRRPICSEGIVDEIKSIVGCGTPRLSIRAFTDE